ncbi:MAG TPA: IS3 family transposase [Burkholderiales bacterium]|nr:IS3 family transposase [Burkholderiales bacterium]
MAGLPKETQKLKTACFKMLDKFMPGSGLSIEVACNLFGVSRSGYYKSKHSKPRTSAEHDLIKQVYVNSKGRYGYRRVCDTLNAKYSLTINHKKVLRIMRELGLKSKIRAKKKYFGINDNLFAANVLNRNFYSEQPKSKLVTDVTYLNVGGKNHYLSVVLDLFNNEVVSYKLSKFNNVLFVLESVKSALQQINSKCILHSDQGHQYTSKAYTSLSQQEGIVKSMSRRGNCLDNACIESFFGHLKSESIYITKVNTYEELTCLIDEYIHFYNNERIQSKLRKMAPIEYRHHFESKPGFF